MWSIQSYSKCAFAQSEIITNLSASVHLSHSQKYLHISLEDHEIPTAQRKGATLKCAVSERFVHFAASSDH